MGFEHLQQPILAVLVVDDQSDADVLARQVLQATDHGSEICAADHQIIDGTGAQIDRSVGGQVVDTMGVLQAGDHLARGNEALAGRDQRSLVDLEQVVAPTGQALEVAQCSLDVTGDHRDRLQAL